MGLIADIKILWDLKKAFEKIKEAYKMNTGIKPGWQTTEFWGKVAVQIFTVLGAVKGFLPAPTATLIISVLEGVYGIARAIVKSKGGELPDVPQP